MNYTFHLVKTTKYDPNPNNGGHYLKVECTSASGPNGFSDPDIFVFQRNVRDGTTGTYDSWFSNIASAVDMQDLSGIGSEPNTSNANPLQFRMNIMEAYFESDTILTECWTAMQQDIAQLSSNLSLREEVSSGSLQSLTIS